MQAGYFRQVGKETGAGIFARLITKVRTVNYFNKINELHE